jgi:hypothetical protein
MSRNQSLSMLFSFLALGSAIVGAQCGSLTTVLTGGTFCTNGGGPMFEVVAVNPAGVRITGFSANLSAGTHSISVYVFTTISTANGIGTPIPLEFEVLIPSGTSRSFHVRAAAGGLRYSSGGTFGGILASNADLQVLIGSTQCSLVAGGGPPFSGSVPSPRNFNGIVHYNKDWQTNTAAASLDIDGVQATACTPAIVAKAQGAPGVVNVASTNVGSGFEIVVSAAPIVPAFAGAFITTGGQIFNLDLGAGVTFLNGGAFPNFAPFPGAFSIPFNAPFASFTVSIQMVVLDPLNPDGLKLSQATQLDIQ